MVGNLRPQLTAEPRCQVGQVLEHQIRNLSPGITVVHHLMHWVLFHFKFTMEPVIKQNYLSMPESKAVEIPSWRVNLPFL